MACEHCSGTGWRIVTRNGLEGAERCCCYVPKTVDNGSTPLTKEYVLSAVARMGGLTFFPGDPAARAAISEMILRMAKTKEQVQWLVATMMDRVGKWHGPLELRGVFCTRYDPADGIRAECGVTPGFTGEALEERQRFLPTGEDVKLLGPARDRELAHQVRELAAGKAMPK